MITKPHQKKRFLCQPRDSVVVLATVLFLSIPIASHAASVSLSPSSGTFSVGSTFDASILLNTQGRSINALDVILAFPPEKLQLVSPSTGQSIIGIWTAQPEFNNHTGRLRLQGVIPNGINVSSGLIGQFTFRVTGVGSAVMEFLDETRVLLNDGKGTEALEEKANGVYRFVLPPPAGPVVASETHPEQGKWYPASSAVLRWGEDEAIQGYSYVLSDEPIDISDDTSEGVRDGVAYRDLASGTHYFHIKALRGGTWGGTTHYALHIDDEPPAEFKTKILPASRTSEMQIIADFFTTDRHSGISHYELKVIPLSPATSPGESEINDSQIFIEVTSPYIIQELERGSYDVVVRAYDKAGNYRESTERVRIVAPLLTFTRADGIRLGDALTIPWVWFFIGVAVLVLILGLAAWRVKEWHDEIEQKRTQGGVTEDVQGKLNELKEYQKRYGKISSFLLVLTVGALLSFAPVSFAPVALAQEEEVTRDTEQETRDSVLTSINPPAVNLVSSDITNEEIFYVGGKTDISNADVVIYLQNLQTGETFIKTVSSDNRGDWFYRHDTFLSSGAHILWVQSKLGNQTSPPSPQVRLTVEPTAIQFGASRISFELLYLTLALVLFFAVLALAGYIIYHSAHGRRKHQLLLREVHEAEESLRRGFAVLRRDLKEELALVRRAKMSRDLSEEEKMLEKRLLEDMDTVEQRIGKEIWDIEEVEQEETHSHEHGHEDR